MPFQPRFICVLFVYLSILDFLHRFLLFFPSVDFHVTFPALGPRFVFAFGLNVRRRGFSNDYNPTINPNMNNEFSTAAFRFGHSLVQGDLP